MQQRRTFLLTLGAAAAHLVTGGRERLLAAAARHGAARIDRVGIQLYTLRSLMSRDLEGTLASVAAIGYREVEFAGYFDRPAKELRALLDRHGLAAPSAHVPAAQMSGDAWRRALDDAAALGHRWVTIPWLPEEDRRSLDSWKRVADRFNEAARAAAAAGLRFAYHNHDFELREVDGIVPFDLMLAETEPSLVDFQIDLYWMVRAGRDPLGYLAAHPGRFPMLHVKDSAGPPDHRMTDVGQGTIDFARILAAFAAAGTTHFFVEHDRPQDPLASATTSYSHLKSLTI